ncbi:MAG: glycosyltransferase [Nitrospira sp.]|nr:glycosyltransferase [Nitrospira sp.]
MRFLILDTDYPAFTAWLYAENPGLEGKPFDEQLGVHTEACFGMAGFCAKHLRALGHDAQDLHVNNEIMQKRWAQEHGVNIGLDWEFRLRRGIVPWISHSDPRRWFYTILAAQIRWYRPDVILNLAMDGISSVFLKEMKPHTGLLAGQIAAYLPTGENWSVYDLVISSLPNFVEYFRGIGVRSEFNRLAFEPSVLHTLKHQKKNILVSFVGSFTSSHSKRDQLLERLCVTLPTNVWGVGIERLPQDSSIRSCYLGAVWGINMFRILAGSKIVINYHSDVAQSYANNMRLYEATGTGALLVTDWKENLHEMFQLEKEVVAYRGLDECVEKVRYYLEHDDEREAIALSGQRKTLQTHTYFQRMQDLSEIISKYL